MSAKAAHAAQHVSLLKPCNSLGLQIPHSMEDFNPLQWKSLSVLMEPHDLQRMCKVSPLHRLKKQEKHVNSHGFSDEDVQNHVNS